MEEEQIIYSAFDYFFILFTFKPILDIILSCFINKFKDKKNNLLLFYSITCSICLYLSLGTSLNFLPSVRRNTDLDNIIVAFLLFPILDLIVTAIFFKKNKKIFITLLSTAFFLFISSILYTYMDYCSGFCKIFLNVNDYIVNLTAIILLIIKTIFSAIYTVYLIFKLGIKLRNKIIN